MRCSAGEQRCIEDTTPSVSCSKTFYDSFAEIEVEYPDVRGLGEQMVAIGRIHTRGNESGARTESPVAAFIEWKHTKAVRVLTYLDPAGALEAAGLWE